MKHLKPSLGQDCYSDLGSGLALFDISISNIDTFLTNINAVVVLRNINVGVAILKFTKISP